ncbi:MAG: hypothetical protein HQL17_07345 [Candidatus Omnitrophica bacterium]|nr:hypothetical protein [Candidatus Omnitrophota bacterium]
MAERIMIILKFVFAVLLLPLVMATVFALQTEIARFDPKLQEAIISGTLAYVLMKFFVYDFDAVYKFGQSIVGACFQFLKPVMNFAPYVIPIYTIIAIVAYAIVHLMGNMEAYAGMFVAVIAFTFAMHVVLTAQDLYTKDSLAGKPNYFFAMSLIFIVDVFFMALLMSLVGKGFSFVHFFQGLSTASGDIYMAVFKQLFVR